MTLLILQIYISNRDLYSSRDLNDRRSSKII